MLKSDPIFYAIDPLHWPWVLLSTLSDRLDPSDPLWPVIPFLAKSLAWSYAAKLRDWLISKGFKGFCFIKKS